MIYLHRLFPFTAFLAFLFLGSCGGGTVGTGGTGSNEFKGQLLASDGTPIVDALVTIEETGDATSSDTKGQFSVQTSTGDDRATILVETSTSRGETIVEGLPEGPVLVEISLVLNEQKRTLEVSSKKVTPKKTPTPTRIPTPLPATPLPVEPPFPVPTPTPTSGVDVTPTPSVAPTAAETPSETPTLSPTSTPIPPAPRKVLLKGSIVDTEQAILTGARIGVVGEGINHLLADDGTFLFREDLSMPLKIAILADGSRDVALIEGISDATKRIVLTLAIKRKLNGGIRIVIKTTRIVDGGIAE